MKVIHEKLHRKLLFRVELASSLTFCMVLNPKPKLLEMMFSCIMGRKVSTINTLVSMSTSLEFLELWHYSAFWDCN